MESRIARQATKDAWYAVSILLIPVVLQLFLVESGLFAFYAAYFSNRAQAILTLLVGGIIGWRLIRHGKVTIGEILYLGFLFLEIAWGWYQQNPLGDIATDAFLLISPLLFIWWGRLSRSSPIYLKRFLTTYLHINLLAFTLLVLPLSVLRQYSWMRADNSLILGVGLVLLIARDTQSSFLNTVGVALTIAFTGHKLTFLQLLANAFALRKKLFSLFKGKALVALLGFALIISAGFGYSAGRTKFLLLSNSIASSIEKGFDFRSVWLSPFDYLDLSTAGRVLELRQVVRAIGETPVTVLFGKGLGAGVDLRETLDMSVVNAHGGVENLAQVRVIHLGFAYTLLKGGIVGLWLYFLILAHILYRGFKLAGNRQGDWWQIGAALSLINYAAATLFTFSFWLKVPAFWILWGAFGRPIMHNQRDTILE